MTTVAPAIFERSPFAFSGNGRYGVCVRISDDRLALESWLLTADREHCGTVPELVIDRESRALPLDDGRILLFQTIQPGVVSPRLVNDDSSVRRFGAIPAPRGGYFLPSPNADQLGFAVTCDKLENSTIWRLSASEHSPEAIMEVPGSLTGGVWLDDEALVLGTNQTRDGSPSNGIAVDLIDGSWKRMWSVSDTSNDRILLYHPHSKLIIVSTSFSGQQRLGWARLGATAVHFPETLYRSGYPREALALDDRGERLLVHEVTGAVSSLLIYIPAEDRLETLACPPGTISAPASWVGDVIRVRFSTPCQPPTLASVRLGEEAEWSISADHAPRGDHSLEGRGERPQLIELAGPAGPIEAIVYGGSDWRTREHLVVALHGGPLSAWRFEFEPLFHFLAAHGVAVVAPNYRGSTGYGDEHLRAVIGNWGGPDLDDVLSLVGDLVDDRPHQLPRPFVMGMSYGAFLALLAACHQPQLWSGCIAIAPFLSGTRFHDSASGAVRHRIEQLGGLRQIDDASGPRDVLRACAALITPLLLIHSADDRTIPVEQSRTLRSRLLELGRTEGIDFDYVESIGDHAELIRAQPRQLNQRVTEFCLTRSSSPFPHMGKWIR